MAELGWLPLAGVALLVLIVLVVFVAGRRRPAPAGEPLGEVLQRQIESVRMEGRDERERMRREVTELRVGVKQEFAGLQQSVASELKSVTSEVTRQLQEGMQLIQSAQSSMGERLDRATTVVGDVQGSLGRLGEATQRIVEVGRDIQGLEHILKSPKVRGGLGETLLEQVLAQMLPHEHWSLQHAFRTGDAVDAVIRIGDRLVPIDAKFPLENFRRLVEEPDEERRRAHRKAFGRDVKARVDEIAKKYILPDEGTYDFALMYVPAENVYYEIIIKDDADSGDEPIATYALAKRVVPVSPNSLYAYLQVIILGLRGLRIEANAREIQSDLARLTGDLEKVREHMRTLGRHLNNAQGQFADAERDLGRFGDRLEAIERKGGEPPALPAGNA